MGLNSTPSSERVHIGIFGKESGVYTYVIDHRLFERTIQKMVSGGKVIWVHVSSF